ncbi:hypothetical protein PIB30_076641 [Stylosanthes scabra]|uniref:Uncharacterized protein n=1 Tax=Stylosanthes scabra TaxID=79078 RepID=A0ABU6TSG8_9FABA|nr:hypothetical protein [Stylosanthes scabra]
MSRRQGLGPALRLLRRSCAESVAFEALRLNRGSTSVDLGDSAQWVNQPMVLLINRSTGLDQSTPVNFSQPSVNDGQSWSKLVNGGQLFFLALARHKNSNGYTRIS